MAPWLMAKAKAKARAKVLRWRRCRACMRGGGLRAAEASVSRRTVLAMALAGAGLSLVPARHVHAAAPCVVENVTGLYAVEVGRVLRPRSREAVRDAVLQWPGRIADPAFAAR
jgi:hypothetical protein